MTNFFGEPKIVKILRTRKTFFPRPYREAFLVGLELIGTRLRDPEFVASAIASTLISRGISTLVSMILESWEGRKGR